MRFRCACLRPGVKDDSEGRSTTNFEGDAAGHTHQGPPQLSGRSVSPADVRRTSSGRLLKQRRDASQVTLSKEHTYEAASPDHNKAALGNYVVKQGSHSQATAERILQPVPAVSKPAVDTASQTLQNHKPQLRKLVSKYGPKQLPQEPLALITDRHPVSVLPPCKSILEASSRRLARHTGSGGMLEADIMQQFLTAYIAAVTQSNQQWAHADSIAGMFAADIVLKTQDKQTFCGRPAVLKRLNHGTPGCMLHHTLCSCDELPVISKVACHSMLYVSVKAEQLVRAMCHKAIVNTYWSLYCPSQLSICAAGIATMMKLMGDTSKLPTSDKLETHGPEQVDRSTWVMTYTMKVGVMKYAIRSQFQFADGKIVLLHNTRI